MNPVKQRNTAILMYLLISLGGIVVDIIVPSLPSIQRALLSNETATQWAFTMAMLGFGFGQIAAGFVVDAFGRKMPMLLGALCLTFSLLLSAVVPDIEALIALRLVQGLAVSLVAVGGRAVIKDLYDGEEYLKAVNWITISFALGITLSPFVGGYIEENFGWQMVFTGLTAWVSLGAVLLAFFFTETHTNHQPLNTETIKGNLSEIVLNRGFQRTAIICGVFYAILPAFNTVSPFIIQETLGYGPVFYGHIALVLGAAWLAGNMANRATFSIPAKSKTTLCLLVSLFALALGIGYQTIQGLSLYAFIAPVAVIIFSLGMLFPLYLGKALAPFHHIAGIANAIVFSGCWLCTALISFLASSLPLNSALPLMILYSALLLLVVRLTRKMNDL
ncbi:hypothetical protein JCM19232_5375 [Vibrio ishigakensis]|uniref:Major facilitator superfamily (MFS) profile domain-containing protein n=1 Tax=Vibrio ishigakensis TaxID=1481914 RepID=A0A0B8P822_9VIBR|nr:hypothetical protein JCM19232_5375 [Vibrio ishigakensis]